MFLTLRKEANALLSVKKGGQAPSSGRRDLASKRSKKRSKSVPKLQREVRGQSIKLPSYNFVEEIKYSYFVRELQAKNPKHKFQMSTVDRALELAIMEIIGEEGLRKFKENSHTIKPRQGGWKILMDQRREFWSGSKGEDGHDEDV